MCTGDVVNPQYDFQVSDGNTDNSIVLLYDPMQTKQNGGNGIVLKAYQLSEEYIQQQKRKSNFFIHPRDVLVELPIRIKNVGHVAGFLRCVEDLNPEIINCDMKSLQMGSGDVSIERHLDAMGDFIDELVQEQHKLQSYSRTIGKTRLEQVRTIKRAIDENKQLAADGEPEIVLSTRMGRIQEPAPAKIDALLMIGQLDIYCQQLNEYVDNNFQKIFVSSKLNV
jgi:hypothetical protein